MFSYCSRFRRRWYEEEVGQGAITACFFNLVAFSCYWYLLTEHDLVALLVGSCWKCDSMWHAALMPLFSHVFSCYFFILVTFKITSYKKLEWDLCPIRSFCPTWGFCPIYGFWQQEVFHHNGALVSKRLLPNMSLMPIQGLLPNQEHLSNLGLRPAGGSCTSWGFCPL